MSTVTPFSHRARIGAGRLRRDRIDPVLARLLRRLPRVSRRLGHPVGLVRTGQLAVAGVVERRVVHPAHQYVLPGPATPARWDTAPGPLEVRLEPEVVVRLREARILGPELALVDAAGRIVADVTPDLVDGDRGHRALRRVWIGRDEPRAGRLALLASGYDGNYHHALLDGVARLALFQQARWEPDVWLFPTRERFQRDVVAALGVSGVAWFEGPRLVAEETWAASFPHSNGAFCPWRVAFLRHSLGRRPESSGTRRKVLITRRGPARRLSCEEALAVRLQAKGWIVADLEGLSLAEQIALFANASAVVAAHGAGLTNLLFAPAGCRVLEVLPTRDVRRQYQAIAAVCGLAYACVPGEGDAHGVLTVDEQLLAGWIEAWTATT